MATPDPSARGVPALRQELRGLTYDQATPEQVAQVREHVRAKLAAADAQWTPEEREQRATAFLARLGVRTQNQESQPSECDHCRCETAAEDLTAVDAAGIEEQWCPACARAGIANGGAEVL